MESLQEKGKNPKYVWSDISFKHTLVVLMVMIPFTNLWSFPNHTWYQQTMADMNDIDVCTVHSNDYLQ